MIKKCIFCLCVVLIGFCSCRPNDDPTKGQDMVVYGTIFTAEQDPAGQPVMAEAMVIRGGKYVYVGSRAGAEPFIKKSMSVVEHPYGLIMPSCTDGHAHYIYGFTRDLVGIVFTEDDYKKDILSKIEQAAKEPQNYIFGSGWELKNLIDDMITRQDLDVVCPDKAVFINDSEVHKALVNTRCLVEAGILSEDGRLIKKSIVGGKIELDADSMPTGFLSEQANTYVRAHVPGLGALVTESVALTAIEQTQQHLLSQGYTAYMDGWGNQWYNDVYVRALHNLDKENKLNLNVGISYEIESWAYEQLEAELNKAQDWSSAYSSKHVMPRYIKLFMDGTVETATGFINGEYGAPFSGSGIVNWTEEQVAAITARANQKGLSMHIHAMGDAATQRVVSAYASSGNKDMRNSMVHVRNISAQDIQQVADHNIIVDMGGIWHAVPDQARPLMDEVLPASIAKQAYPMRSFFDKKAIGVSHTDFPATSGSQSDPFGVMEIMVTGMKPDHSQFITPWEPSELLTREQALTALTIHGAYQLFMESSRGSIKEGKFADFILVDKNVLDPTACPDADIHTAVVEATYFEGKKVYNRNIRE